MNNYYKHLLLLLKRLILLILIFQLSRFFFLIFNLKYFDLSFNEIARSFFFGIRFDWFIIVIFNSLFIFLHLIPGKFKNNISFQAFLKYLFLITNSAVLLLNFIDIEYFKFTSKRATYDFINMINGEGLYDHISHFINDFWYIALTWIFSVILLVLLYAKYRKVEFINFEITRKDYLIHSGISLIIILVFCLTARGIGPKPTNIVSATSYTAPRNISLVVNTPFTILRSYYHEDLEMKMYIPESSLEKFYDPTFVSQNSPIENKPNIVVLVFKGLSKDYMGFYTDSLSCTPFLDSLFEHSLTFNHSFANGNSTIDAVPAILASIPALSERTYIYSRYISNSIFSIPDILNEYGYETSFLHGSKKKAMGLNHFTDLVRFDNYLSKKLIKKNKNDIDENKNVFDLAFLNHCADYIVPIDSSFFSFIMTSTVQHPFSLPDSVNETNDIHTRVENSISYTDNAFRSFFNKISKAKWYKNTLFVITSDQSSYNSKNYIKNDLNDFAIPLAFYHPGDTSLSGRRDQIIQHTDIFPSIIDYLGIKDTILCFGNSIFDSLSPQYAINYKDGIYQFIQSDVCLQFDGANSIGAYYFKNDTLFSTNLLQTADEYKSSLLEVKLKAVIQQFNNRMIRNETGTIQ